MDTKQQKFGLFTTIAMIVGVVIGSGIFFKADEILIAAQGNTLVGALLLTVGAIGIVFGGLSIATYARENSTAGGLITYVEDAWGKTLGYLSGWFQAIFYYPALIAVLSWIAAVYLGIIFNITNPEDYRLWLITLIIIASSFGLNILNTYAAGKFQNITLIIKIASLLLISFAALFLGDKQNFIADSTKNIELNSGIFVGLIACAFSYDGWFVAPTIAHEIKDPKRNLSRALVLAPLIILVVYLIYFIGVSTYLGADTVIELGDQSVGVMAQSLFGKYGGQFIYVCVVISILGSINGLVLSYIRLPYSLALRDRFPASSTFKKMNTNYSIPLNSAWLTIFLVLSWIGLHALSVFRINILGLNFSFLQIDSLPIVLTYFFYVSLYIALIRKQIKTKQYSFRDGILYPSLATLGASLVLYGGLTQPGVLVYFLISFVGIAVGYLFMHKD